MDGAPRLGAHSWCFTLSKGRPCSPAALHGICRQEATAPHCHARQDICPACSEHTGLPAWLLHIRLLQCEDAKKLLLLEYHLTTPSLQHSNQ